VREVTHVVDGVLDVVAEPLQGGARLALAMLMKVLGGESEPDSQPGQLLLDAVVEVLLDALSLRVRGGYETAGHPGSRGPRKPGEKADAVVERRSAGWPAGAVRRRCAIGCGSAAQAVGVRADRCLLREAIREN
jgi:hypothetical protein